MFSGLFYFQSTTIAIKSQELLNLNATNNNRGKNRFHSGESMRFKTTSRKCMQSRCSVFATLNFGPHFIMYTQQYLTMQASLISPQNQQTL